MSKTNDAPDQFDEDDLLPEYDFSKGVRGKHHQAYQQGHSVTISHQDGTTTTQEFPPSRMINKSTSENQVTLDRSITNKIFQGKGCSNELNEYFDVNN
jgi:hypothetical protein